MIKVSFDFDGTLALKSVQKYAKSLVDRNFNVFITTSRFHESNAPRPDWNDDLYKVADELGIQRDNIRYTNMVDKFVFFEHENFLWHLDDDWQENRMILKYTKTIAISHIGSGNWIGKCERLIKKKLNEL